MKHGSAQHESLTIAREGFRGTFGQKSAAFKSDRIWSAFRERGSLLWLDTGDVREACGIWSREFTHLTTNTSLVNREAQTGAFDSLIPVAAARLREADPDIDRETLVREIGFIINCRVALRLVEALDAFVSVGLHPAVANDTVAAVELARRYHAVCPERFTVKVPQTPAGYLSVRQLAREGIPVNFTMGFSARQNYLAAIISRPQFVNLFLGRLTAFAAENGLSNGKNVGEKAALATQLALWRLREQTGGIGPRLIGASVRDPQQAINLAGIDGLTIPPRVAHALHEHLLRNPVALPCCAQQAYDVKLLSGVKLENTGLSTLWTIPEDFCRVVKRLAGDRDALSSPEHFVDYFAANGYGDLFRHWTPGERELIRHDGKIPQYARWQYGLRSGALGLDDIMTTSALESFAQDQQQLDCRIRAVIDT